MAAHTDQRMTSAAPKRRLNTACAVAPTANENPVSTTNQVARQLAMAVQAQRSRRGRGPRATATRPPLVVALLAQLDGLLVLRGIGNSDVADAAARTLGWQPDPGHSTDPELSAPDS